MKVSGAVTTWSARSASPAAAGGTPARTTALRWRSSSRCRSSCGHQLAVDVRQYPGKLLDPPNALRAARSEDFGKRVDSRRPDADVVDGDARVVGLLDRVRDVGPRVTPLVALVGDQTVTDDQEQPPLGGLSEKSTGQVAQRRSEPGVPAGGQAEVSRRHEPSILEVLEAADLDAVPRVAGEHEDSVALPRERHRSRQRVCAGQLQFEDP